MNIATIRNQFLLLVQQWQRSLAVFEPVNFKRFTLVSMNAFLKGTKTFFIYFWWLPFIPCFFTATSLALFGLTVNWLLIWRITLWFFIFLSVRPSIDLKTARYYVAYLPRLIEFAFFILIVSAIQRGVSILDVWLPIPIFAWFIERILFVFHNITAFMLIPSPLLLFVGFFLLDRSESLFNCLNAGFRAFKMVYYVYPFCIISLLVLLPVFFLGDFLIALVIRFLPITIRCFVDNLFMTLYHIFVASWFSTIYIKRAHEDFSLYFG